MTATTQLEVLFTPADFATLRDRDLSGTTCVVFDVLRATTSMITALANGAEAIIPVAEIPEALAVWQQRPEVILAGERQGLRITAELTSGTEFDLGNSPREFTAEKVHGKTVAITTTNGTRALRACVGAETVLVGCLLNLQTTANWLKTRRVRHLIVVGSGTFEQAALEDTLAAGGLVDKLWPRFAGGDVSDAALMARQLYTTVEDDLPQAIHQSRNGRRLLANADLRDDVAFCLQRDTVSLVAALDRDGAIRRLQEG